MAAMESQGRDIKLDEKRVEGYRNFATKLWNAARFLQGNGVGASQSIAAPEAALPVNRWIIGEVVETLAKLDKAIADLRYDEMADAIYHFTWGTFCDWYVELIKGAWDDETRAVAAWAFDQILVMLHPFMPFVTEELWHSMGERPYELIVAKWPAPEAKRDESGERGNRLAGRIHRRSARHADRIEHAVERDARPHRRRLQIPGRSNGWRFTAPTLSRMAKLGLASASESVPEGSAQIVVGGVTFAFPLAGAIDLDAERSRLSKAVTAAEKDRDSLSARLNNPAFTERAKPEAVEKARADHDARAAEAERLARRLGAARLGESAVARRGHLDGSPRHGDGHRGPGRNLAVDRDLLPRPGFDAQFAAAEFGDRPLAVRQLEQGREPAPGEAEDALAGHRLDDDLAAAELGAFDQLDPAVVAAVGDARFGRPDAGPLAILLDSQAKRAKFDRDIAPPRSNSRPCRDIA